MQKSLWQQLTDSHRKTYNFSTMKISDILEHSAVSSRLMLFLTSFNDQVRVSDSEFKYQVASDIKNTFSDCFNGMLKHLVPQL